MKNEIQTLANMLFWEKYIDVISDANNEEFIRDFHKVLNTIMPSVTFKVICTTEPQLHQTIYQVTKIVITI